MLGEALALTLGLAEGLALGETSSDGLALALTDALSDADTLGDRLGLTDTLGDTEALALGDSDGDTDADRDPNGPVSPSMLPLLTRSKGWFWPDTSAPLTFASVTERNTLAVFTSEVDAISAATSDPDKEADHRRK
jgi:hypothetical protein